MWFLCSKCKIFLDIKLGDPTNPMGLNRNQATFKQASATEAAGAFRFVFLSESRRFGKASQTSRDHLTTIAGDLGKRGASVCRVLQVDKSATSCKWRNYILWVATRSPTR
jgi:hypothetical protein